MTCLTRRSALGLWHV